MKSKSFSFFFTATCLTLTGIAIESAPAKAVSITNNANANALVSALLGPSSGLTFSNATYTGATAGAGTFTGGNAANLGIDNGIILSTGIATNNTQDPSGYLNDNNGFGGTGSIGSSYDAVTLSFDFTSNTGNLFLLDYVFASEEYRDFVNEPFNDQFRFLIDGQDIALVPGTNDIVSINTVNNGGGLSGLEPATNSQYFRDNSNDSIGLKYNGFTTVLSANSLAIGNLGSGTHTFQIVIADVADEYLNSAVFLKNSSFSSTPTYQQAVPEPFTVIGTLIGGTAALRMRKKLKSTTKK